MPTKVKASSYRGISLFQQCFLVFTIVVLTKPQTSTAAEEEITWWNIYKFLREFVNNGLVADTLQDKLDNGYKWETTEVNGQKRLDRIKTRVSKIFEDCIKVVRTLKTIIENEYDTWPSYSIDQVNSSVLCCERARNDPTSDGCALAAQPQSAKAIRPPQTVLREMKKSASIYKHKISQYFAFNDGSTFVYPVPSIEYETCKAYDPRLRYYFTQCKSPEARKVVIVVDTGAESDVTFLQEVVERLFEALSPIDRMGLCLPDGDKCRTQRVGADSQPKPVWPGNRFPLGTQSLLGDIVASSEKNKRIITKQFQNWLRSTVPMSRTSADDQSEIPGPEQPDVFSSHEAALAAGYELFKKQSFENSYRSAVGNYHRILIYVTARSGWYQWYNQEEQLNKTISDSIHVVIHPLLNAATGLRDEIIMKKGNITVKIVPYANRRKLLSSPTSIASFGLTDPDKPVIPIPYWDAFGAGYIMSICLPLTNGTQFLGTSCIDFSIVNLLESETNVDDIENAYVFIVNSLGNTLMHPFLPSPHSLTQDPSYITIDSLEQATEVRPLLELIVSHTRNATAVSGMQVQPIGHPRGTKLPSPVKVSRHELLYLWEPIDKTDLTITLVLPLQEGKVISSEYRCPNATACETSNFAYHIPKPSENRKLCKFFGTVVTENKGLVKFAPSCFLDVLSYIQGETPDQISKLYAIFNGTVPGDELLRSDLRASVRLLEDAEMLWQKQLEEEPKLRKFMGARFMGTVDGAFITFPGTTLRQLYDHRTRAWFLQAMSNPEKASVSMTTPYCDEWGAGIVYTITKTIHDTRGNPVAVVAGDLSLQYVMEEFRKQVSHCQKHTCLLVDSLGYVVLKSDWLPINSTGRSCANDTKVSAHLNRLAPDIARDMIDKRILQRRVCHDYKNDLTFYYWLLSFIGHQTFYKGQTYEAYKIPQTNLYLIVRTEDRFSGSYCNCDENQRGMEVMCHDTCDHECECPCMAGPNTIPCYDSTRDVHRYPVPACKPRGITTVTASDYDSTKDELERCS